MAFGLGEFVGPVGAVLVLVVHVRKRHGVAAVACEAARFRHVPLRFVRLVVAIDVHVVDPRQNDFFTAVEAGKVSGVVAVLVIDGFVTAVGTVSLPVVHVRHGNLLVAQRARVGFFLMGRLVAGVGAVVVVVVDRLEWNFRSVVAGKHLVVGMSSLTVEVHSKGRCVDVQRLVNNQHARHRRVFHSRGELHVFGVVVVFLGRCHLQREQFVSLCIKHSLNGRSVVGRGEQDHPNSQAERFANAHLPRIFGVEVHLRAHPSGFLTVPFASLERIELHLVPSTFAIEPSVVELRHFDRVLASVAFHDVYIVDLRFIRPVSAMVRLVVDLGQQNRPPAVFANEEVHLIAAVGAVVDAVVEFVNANG